MNKPKKIENIDYIKGMAILLVFIGHAATPSFLTRPYGYEFTVQAIYSFHMPVFFLVSGFLAIKILDMDLKKTYLKFAKGKLCRLGIPFLTISVITNVIFVVLKPFLNGAIEVGTPLDMIKNVFIYPENGIMGALWFLYTLLAISLITPFITKLPLKLAIFIAVLLNIFMPNSIMFLSISRISFFLVYFLIGIYFRKHYYEQNRSPVQNLSVVNKIVLFTISLLGIISYAYIVTNGLVMSTYLLATLGLICGLLGMILVLITIDILNSSKILKVLGYVGQYSMDIYLLSWFFQITSMILMSKILKIHNYTIFFASNLIIGSLCLPFSVLILRKFKILKLLVLGENSKKSKQSSTVSTSV